MTSMQYRRARVKQTGDRRNNPITEETARKAAAIRIEHQAEAVVAFIAKLIAEP